MSDELLRPLPCYLQTGLRAVFIGYNPGVASARAGRYYAHPGNAFWRHLSASGLVGREVGPQDDSLLPGEAGIGFVDLCRRPSVRASELSGVELREGALRLLADLRDAQPLFAVFSGRGIYQAFGRHALGIPAGDLARRSYGEQPERIGLTRPFVVPSSSGLASKWHAERVEWLRRLASQLAGPEHA